MIKKQKKYSGLGLVEMLVAILIVSVCMIGITLLFMRTWQINAYTLEMGQSSMAVSQSLTKIVNYIRGARQGDDGSYPVVSADKNDLVLYSDYDKDGIAERLHFYKSGEDILMGVTKPSETMPKTYPSGDQSTLTIASYIVNDSDTPIFYYYDKNYAGGVQGGYLDTPASPADIRLMRIYFKINIVADRAPDNIEMQSFVELRNLNDYDRVK